MKKIIASVIAGLVLGSTGTAVAAQQLYWSRGGNGYLCEGVSSGVICKSGHYDVGVTKSFVYVQEHGTEFTFGCRKTVSFSSCVSD